MAKTWWSITVELVEGRADRFWPRPGRVLAAAPSHTFADLADAIDTAFARWDRAHLNEFRLADDIRIGMPDADWGEEDILDVRTTKLSALSPGDKFARRGGHQAGRSAPVLGLGQHSRPVRPSLG
jgi:hypothetical protein